MNDRIQLRAAGTEDLEQLLGKALCEASFCKLLRRDVEAAARLLGLRLTAAQLNLFKRPGMAAWLEYKCRLLAKRCEEAEQEAKATHVYFPPLPK